MENIQRPCRYFPDGEGNYIFFTQKTRAWWENLQHRRFDIRIAGQTYKSKASVVHDSGQITDALKRSYPRMSAEEIRGMEPNLVMICVHTY